MTLPSDLHDKILEIHANVNESAQRLRAEAEIAEREALYWTKLSDYLANGWILHFRNCVAKDSRATGAEFTENRSHTLILNKAMEATADESARILRRFPELIEKAFSGTALVMDSTSRHPKYTFEQGFLKLEIDDKKGIARLSNNESKLTELPADIPAILEAVESEYRRLFGRPFDGEQFLKTLRLNYNAIITKEKASDGSSLPIRKITQRMGKNVKGFRTDEFLVDLSRLAASGPLVINGRRLDLQQTKDTNQGMLLCGSAGRGYIGFIVFREVEYG